MRTGKHFRAYPTPAQEKILLQWIGHPRFGCNAKVSEDRYDRVFAKKADSFSKTPVSVDEECSRFIGENAPCLPEVPPQRLRNRGGRGKEDLSGARPETPPAAQSA